MTWNIKWGYGYNLLAEYNDLQTPITLMGLMWITSDSNAEHFYLIDYSGYVLIVDVVSSIIDNQQILSFNFSYSNKLISTTPNPDDFTTTFNNLIQCTSDGKCIVCCYPTSSGYNYYYSSNYGISFNSLNITTTSPIFSIYKYNVYYDYTYIAVVDNDAINLWSLGRVISSKITIPIPTQYQIKTLSFSTNSIYGMGINTKNGKIYYLIIPIPTSVEITNSVVNSDAVMMPPHLESFITIIEEEISYFYGDTNLTQCPIFNGYIDATGQFLITTIYYNSKLQLLYNESYLDSKSFTTINPVCNPETSQLAINSINNSNGNYLILTTGEQVLSTFTGIQNSSGNSNFMTESFFDGCIICAVCTAWCDSSTSCISGCIGNEGGSSGIFNFYCGLFTNTST